MRVSQIEEMLTFVDIFQVGARISQNFNLSDELNKIDKSVMLKRRISGTIEELIPTPGLIFANEKFLLYTRRISSFEQII